MAGFLRSVCGGVSPISPPSESLDPPLAEQARNRDHHSGGPYGQASKQRKVAQEKGHTRASLCSCAGTILTRHGSALGQIADTAAKNLQAVDVKTSWPESRLVISIRSADWKRVCRSWKNYMQGLPENFEGAARTRLQGKRRAGRSALDVDAGLRTPRRPHNDSWLRGHARSCDGRVR